MSVPPRQIVRVSIQTAAWLCLLAPISWETAYSYGQETRSRNRDVPRSILSEREWQQVEEGVDRGLGWLSRRQQPSGSFHPIMRDEPGVTALCVLAFLSRGHLPGEGPYGEQLNRAVNFILESQMQDGLIARERHAYHGAYSHGIGALVVAELYGMSKPADDARHRQVIERAMKFTSRRYSQPKATPADEGGWRYLRRHGMSDADLSLTSWNVMFLRSAKNSGFEVDVKLIDEALAYMQRLYDAKRRTFRYEINTDAAFYNYSRGMAGAGVLSMSLAGLHDSKMAVDASQYILRQPFKQYSRPEQGEQYPCYSAFYCSQAMFHMGGDYWREFYPVLARSVLESQRNDGSWIMKEGTDIEYGVSYMTALSVLALTPPYQTLPIFQR